MQYLKKEVDDEVYFWHVDKNQSLLQVGTIILGLCDQACSKYPKWKVCISLQYLKKELSDEVEFLYTDKHESLLQIDSMILMVKHSQSSQNSKFAMSISKKKLKVKLIFYMQINIIKVSYKTLWSSKFPTRVMLLLSMGVIKHSQITQSNKFAISLQSLKKEIRNGGHFWHVDKSQSFYKLVLSFLMEVAIHVQNAQNRKLVIFSQYIKKKLSQLLCVPLWCKSFRCFTWVYSCLLLLVIGSCLGEF